MSEGRCGNPACGRPFVFRSRDYTERQRYCTQQCRLAAQNQRQATRKAAARAAARALRPPPPAAPRQRRPPSAVRRVAVAEATREAARRVAEECCPDCGSTLAHDEALVYCRMRALGRCHWMQLLTQRERDPGRHTDKPDDDTDPDDPSPGRGEVEP